MSGEKQPRWDSRARAGVGGVPPGSCYEPSCSSILATSKQDASHTIN